MRTPFIVTLILCCVVAAVSIITSRQRQACLEAGYRGLSGYLWEPYCVRRGGHGQDEIARLRDLRGE